MRIVGAAILALLASIGAARAEGETTAVPAPTPTPATTLTAEQQSTLEGVWKGIDAMSDASKLCSAQSTSNTTVSIEFLRTGGMIFYSDGTEATTRAALTGASATGDFVTLTSADHVYRFRMMGKETMASVRSSASLGSDVDDMVYKRCEKPGDRAAIALDATQLKTLAADMPGDEAFFIDTRLAAKSGDRCNVEQTQYLFFALIGPTEFRLSRWNSFALADKAASGGNSKLPLDPVADWRITSARLDGGKYVFQITDYEKASAPVHTIHLEGKPNGEYAIPEWKRTYVRCTGFQSRS